jgi:hypothetical protein
VARRGSRPPVACFSPKQLPFLARCTRRPGKSADDRHRPGHARLAHRPVRPKACRGTVHALLASAAKKFFNPVVDVDRDAAIPADRYRVQWVLTEIADEYRYSVMFARTAETFGAPSYPPPPSIVRLGKAFVKRFDASGGLVDFLCDDGLVGGPSELLRKRARMS